VTASVDERLAFTWSVAVKLRTAQDRHGAAICFITARVARRNQPRSASYHLRMRISVAITNYNYGRFVGGAVESVLGQTRPADQIVLVDDGSSDDSLSVIQSYSSRVTVVSTENRGVVAATNKALACCNGEIVAMLDADDLLDSERLASIEAVYEANPDVCWVFNGLQRIDRTTMQSLAMPRRADFQSDRYDVRREMAKGSTPLGAPPSSALSFRLSLVKSFLPIPDGVENQDTFLALLAMARSVGYLINDPLTLQGMHGDNRFSATGGRGRDRYLANHYVSVATGYNALGADLYALADNFAARALSRSWMGLLLSAKQKHRLIAHLKALGGERRARIAKFLATRSFYSTKRRLRRLVNRAGAVAGTRR